MTVSPAAEETRSAFAGVSSLWEKRLLLTALGFIVFWFGLPLACAPMQNEAAQEALIRYVVAEYEEYFTAEDRRKPWQLEVDGAPAFQSLIDRLGDLPIEVRNEFDPVLTNDGLVDRNSGILVGEFRIESVNWKTPWSVHLEFEMFEDIGVLSGATYVLTWTSGGWRVQREYDYIIV